MTCGSSLSVSHTTWLMFSTVLVRGSVASVSACNRCSFLSVSLVMISSAISMSLNANCSFCTFTDPSTFCTVVTSSVLSHLRISIISPCCPCCAYCSILIVSASVCSCSSLLVTVCSLLTLSHFLFIVIISPMSEQTIWTFSDSRLLLESSCPVYPSRSVSRNWNYCHPATTLYFLNILTRTCSIFLSLLSTNCLSYTRVTWFLLSVQTSNR